MPTITLPDKTERSFPEVVTVLDVAADIHSGLARRAVAGEVNGQLVDLAHRIDADATVRIITPDDEEGVEVLRHSTAHLLAHAVKRLFPESQVTIGPVIENGFYYDFSFKRGFTPDDLTRIEKEMKSLVKANYPIHREEVSRDEAVRIFSEMGEDYKVKIIKKIPADETLSLYRQEEFVDLCRGPHVQRTGALKAFKLTKTSGAYWEGDSSNDVLQRIYGTAWPNAEKLKQYLSDLEEAAKRDHRELAKKMHIFSLLPEAPGMPFWLPNGWTLNQILRNYLREKQLASGYQEINTPTLVDINLWERSGHKAKFSNEMFLSEVEGREYAIKPMSCPCHVMVFKQGLKSYRDLPYRLSEFGHCHRNELSGALHGLMRARSMVQDDGHIFCTEDQIQSEVTRFITEVHSVYRDFGFTQIEHRLATRPPERVGSDAIWDKAELALSNALDQKKIAWKLLEGEGAFYGPKIEFHLKDCLGRMWQCGTMQVDFSIPERLEARYISEEGSKQTPVMLHRAILGSIERFIAILLENTAGWLPLWLTPVQAIVSGISDRQSEYAVEIVEKLQKMGFRARLDLRNEKISYKIREHTIARVPWLLVLGDREMADRTITVRLSETGLSSTMGIDDFIEKMKLESAVNEAERGE